MRIFWVLFVLGAILLTSCNLTNQGASVYLRFVAYNVQNVFDDVLKGDEYDEFRPGESNWDTVAYHRRLEALARTLYAAGKTENKDRAKGPVYSDPGDTEPGEIAQRTAPEAYPDFVVLEEIESEKVIADLVRDHLPGGTYPYSQVQIGDGGLIHIAVLSKIAIADLSSHNIWVNGETSRAVWEIALELPRGASTGMVVFANHWKSKSGGEKEGEALRIAAARIIAHRAAVLSAEKPGIPMLVMGDLNETIEPGPEAPAKRALSPWTDSFDEESASGVLAIASPAELASERRDGRDLPAWVSPWPEAGEPGGSYNYDQTWEAIDHVFLNPAFFDGNGIEYRAFAPIMEPFLLDASGHPFRYDAWKGKGFSDHLPIRLDLESVTE